VSEYDPAQQPSRAWWKRGLAFEDYKEAERLRLERLRQEYQETLKAECVHGPRVKTIGLNGGDWWAGLRCPEGSPLCGVKYLGPEAVYRGWGDSPAG
jgi:hypothetical protein